MAPSGVGSALLSGASSPRIAGGRNAAPVDFNSCWAALPDQIRQRVEPLLAGASAGNQNPPPGRSVAWNAAAQYA